MEAQRNEVQEGQQADEVMDSMGVPEHDESHEPEQAREGERSNETLAVQKRLKQQKRAHEREVRELHARIGDLESRMAQPMQTSNQQLGDPSMPAQGGMDDQIHKAVSYALQRKEELEREARNKEMQAHVHRQLGELQKHLDNMGDKYEDFHDVVMANTVPFTNAMRDYSLTLPKSGAGSAGEVLYKLGKNPEELERISKLHPLDQASEMAKLSHALISGGESKSQSSKPLLGNVKNNPVINSRDITDRTPISEIRARMKAGWK